MAFLTNYAEMITVESHLQHGLKKSAFEVVFMAVIQHLLWPSPHQASPAVGEKEAAQKGLDLQLQEVQKEVVVVREELDSCKQSSDRLQELLQVGQLSF